MDSLIMHSAAQQHVAEHVTIENTRSHRASECMHIFDHWQLSSVAYGAQNRSAVPWKLNLLKKREHESPFATPTYEMWRARKTLDFKHFTWTLIVTIFYSVLVLLSYFHSEFNFMLHLHLFPFYCSALSFLPDLNFLSAHSFLLSKIKKYKIINECEQWMWTESVKFQGPLYLKQISIIFSWSGQ